MKAFGKLPAVGTILLSVVCYGFSTTVTKWFGNKGKRVFAGNTDKRTQRQNPVTDRAMPWVYYW